MALPNEPVLLYDGSCGFCSASSRRLKKQIPDGIMRIPFQDWERLGHSTEGLRGSVVLLEAGSVIRRGAEAILRVRALGGRPFWLDVYRRSRIFRRFCDTGYGLISRHRRLLSKLLKLSPDLP